MLKRADLHLHTRFSEWKHFRSLNPRDSYNDPLAAYRRCKEIGMDYVAFTDHDTIHGALHLLSKHPELEPEVIIGEEVETYFPDTGQWAHVNVFDIDESIHRDIQRARANIFELIPYLRGRGLLYVLNHPFQSYRVQKPALDYVDEILSLFDHFEVGNATLSSRHNKAVAEMLDYALTLYERKHGVGGSDAHNLRNIGMYWTEAPLPGTSGKRDWLAAVARGEGIAAGRGIGSIRLTADVYRMVMRYYLSLRDPEVRKGMRVGDYLAAALFAPVAVAGLPVILNLSNTLRLEAVTLYLRRALRKVERAQPAELPRPDLLRDPLD